MTDQQSNSKPSGCGGFVITLIIIAAISYFFIDKSDFYLMPGEANLSTEALQKTFDEIDQILPDSLIITDSMNPIEHYQSAQSFGNIYYGVNPILDVVAKSDTSRKYKFQYIARVDHVDADEFVIRDFMVDSVWPYQSMHVESKGSFTE